MFKFPQSTTYKTCYQFCYQDKRLSLSSKKAYRDTLHDGRLWIQDFFLLVWGFPRNKTRMKTSLQCSLNIETSFHSGLCFDSLSKLVLRDSVWADQKRKKERNSLPLPWSIKRVICGFSVCSSKKQKILEEKVERSKF